MMRIRRFHPWCASLLLGLLWVAAAVPGWAQGQGQPEKTANPITRFFQKLDRGVKGEPEPADPEGIGKDQFDARTPQQPEVARRLDEAELAIRERRWGEAVQLLQFLLDKKEDSLILDEDGRWESLHTAAERLLESAPEEVQRDYATRFEMLARAQLERAIARQDEAELVEIVHRFFHTAAGRRALGELGRIWRDRGDFRAAAAAFNRLADFTADPTAQGEFRWLAAECAALAGDSELVETLSGQKSPPDWFSPPVEPAGTAANATPPGVRSEPLLLPDWSVEATSTYPIRQQIHDLWSDLEEQDKAPVLVQAPLIVGDLVVVRTLQGIEVRRCRTGELLWWVAPPGNPEEQLVRDQESEEPWQDAKEIEPYEPGTGDSHPLASVLYRDTVYGSLTTDGRHLFVVDQQRVLEPQQSRFYWQSRFGDGGESGPVSNSIVAYDLRSGLIRWRVGGPDLEPQFSRPLAGTYFFGPPTVDGEELFAVGERDGDDFLYCLWARTGEVLWSQMVATAGRPIAEDVIRRWWRCAPVVSDGLVICPTTSGWLIAVDRHLHTLRWAYRYMLRNPSARHFRGGYAAHSIQDLNVRWPSTSPLVAGRRLVVSPPELPDEFSSTQPLVACLDLLTGEELWRQPKGELEALAVEGIWRNFAVVLARRSVKGIDLATGATEWEVMFPIEEALPSGRGVLTGNDYLVALNDRSIVRVDLARREVDRFEPSADTPSLGSLAVGEKSIVSFSPLALSAFPPKPTPEELAAAARSKNAAVRIRRAEVLAAEGRLSDALAALADAEITRAAGDDPKTRDRIRRLEWEWRAALLRKDLSDPSGHLERLRELAADDEQEQVVLRLNADRLRMRGQLEAALAAYFGLMSGSEAVWLEEGTRTIRLDRWIAGRIQTLFRDASGAEQARLDVLVRSAADELLEKDPSALRLLAGVLEFHPLSQELNWKLALQRQRDGEPTLAAVAFRRATTGSDAELTAKARRRLDEVMGQLVEEIAVAEGPAAAREERESAPPARVADAPTSGAGSDKRRRGGRPLEVVRTSETQRQLDLFGVMVTGEPLWGDRPLRFLYEIESSRLCIEDLPSGRLVWSAGLRSLPLLEYHGHCSVHQEGAISYALHQGVVHALTVGPRRRLWSYEPHTAGRTSRRLRAPGRPSNYTMLNPNGFLANSRLGARPKLQGYFQDASAKGVLVFADSLSLLDPETGALLWREDGVSKSAMAWLIGEMVLVVAPGEPPRLLRLSDGAPAEREALSEVCRQAIAVVDEEVISFEEEQDGREGRRRWTLRARVLPDFAETWSVPIPADASLAFLDEQTVCVLSGERALSLLDLSSGTSRILGQLPKGPEYGRNGLVVVSDQDRVYVIADFGRAGASYIGLPSVRANGYVLAFDRKEGAPLWELDTSRVGLTPQNEAGVGKADDMPDEESEAIPVSLSLQEFDHCPLLVFLGDRPVNKDDLYYRRLRILCVDKATREVVLDWVRPSDSGGFSQMHYDALHETVELRTYNERLQIRLNASADGKEAAGEAP